MRAACSLGELVAFRILQGAGGGMLAPVGMAMLFRAFPPAERVRASAILTIPTTIAPALGPVLGGLFVTDLSWRWVFYVNVPIGVAAFTFGALFLEQSVQAQPGRFDLVGFVLSGCGLGLLMYGVSEGPVQGWGPAGDRADHGRRGAAGGHGGGRAAAPAPMMDLRLFGDRLFRSGNAVMVLASVAFIGTLFLMALFFQDGLGLSALGPGSTPSPRRSG